MGRSSQPAAFVSTASDTTCRLVDSETFRIARAGEVHTHDAQIPPLAEVKVTLRQNRSSYTQPSTLKDVPFELSALLKQIVSGGSARSFTGI